MEQTECDVIMTKFDRTTTWSTVKLRHSDVAFALFAPQIYTKQNSRWSKQLF